MHTFILNMVQIAQYSQLLSWTLVSFLAFSLSTAPQNYTLPPTTTHSQAEPPSGMMLYFWMTIL